jgi:hypothetical protein
MYRPLFGSANVSYTLADKKKNLYEAWVKTTLIDPDLVEVRTEIKTFYHIHKETEVGVPLISSANR